MMSRQVAQIVEATINKEGAIVLLQPIELSASRRAIVVILDDESDVRAPMMAVLNEAALAADWNRPEEDAAWSYLQRTN
jgi:hypothetical protein